MVNVGHGSGMSNDQGEAKFWECPTNGNRPLSSKRGRYMCGNKKSMHLRNNRVIVYPNCSLQWGRGVEVMNHQWKEMRKQAHKGSVVSSKGPHPLATLGRGRLLRIMAGG